MSLCEVIQAAFADAPYPGDQNITQCPCDECKEISTYFRGKTWRGHRLEDLRRHETALFHCTPEAFRYFLPAFILATLEDFECAAAIPDLIVRTLTRDVRDPGPALADERINEMSPQERAAVAQFLKYLTETGDCRPDEVATALGALENAPYVGG